MNNSTQSTHPENAGPKAVSDGDFTQKVLQSDLPVLVDFWATWCGPCRSMGPILETIASEYEGRLHVFKLDVDKNPNTPPQYGISSIPSLLLFKNGQLIAQQAGAQPKIKLKAWLDKFL